PYAPTHRLSTENVESWGNVVSAEMFCRHRQALEAAMVQALEVALSADREWGELSGRSHGLVERYRCDRAHTVVVAIGSMCGTARDAIDELRDAGEAVGLLKIRLLRPLPVQALRAALVGVPDVVVLDRNHSPGLGGIVHQELRGALYGMPDAPRIHGFLAGVGGVNVSPAKIVEIVREAMQQGEPPVGSVWVK
ncbi:MAG: pyruvate ferredoxin oxidoreductase, partial [Burkholderiales bacterium]